MYKNIFKILLLLFVVTGCKKQDFVDANTDHLVLYGITPESQFLTGSKAIVANDFEYYYEIYRDIMPWLQLNTPTQGNQRNFTQASNPFSRYSNLFGRGGGIALYDVNQLIAKLPSPQKESYMQLGAFARILLDYSYFYVSDVYGSLPYTEAFQGRYTGVYTVPFNKQQDIFNLLEADLKAAISDIKNAPAGQVAINDYDQFYYGDASKWIKAANALRLRLAMRLMKQDATTASAIISDVLASPSVELMESNDDSWALKTTSGYASGGNWNPDGLRGTKALIDFMLKTNDPRLRIYYTKNSYSQQNFEIAKDTGFVSPGATFVNQRYVGSYASPDSAALPAIRARYYTTKTINKGSGTVVLDTLSNINPRLFQTAFAGGTGIQYFPLITYADYGFMRAELAATGAGAGDAKEWYEKAVTASIEYYGKMATDGQLVDYYLEGGNAPAVTAPTAAEISSYLQTPEVAFDESRALDLIASQSFLNFFKEPNEAWALVKRTGLPNNSTSLMLENLYYNGTLLTIPRRAPLDNPTTGSINYDNIMAAITEMQADPNYGSGPGDISGRVWWDKP